MDHPRAAGSSAGGPPAAGSGSVVVPIDIDIEAAAAAAAPPAAGGARRTRVPVRVRVMWPRPPVWSWTRLNARLWAAALFLLGCAAAGLAFFAMILPAADSHLLVKACAPASDLRSASEYLLLAASAQVLGATVGLLLPTRSFAALGSLLGWLTGYRALDVLWMLVSCHGSTSHGALAFHFWLFFAMLCAALLVVGRVISRG